MKPLSVLMLALCCCLPGAVHAQMQASGKIGEALTQPGVATARALANHALVPAYNAIDYQTHPQCAVEPRNTFLQIVPEFNRDNAYLMLLTSALTEEKPGQIYDQLHHWGFAEPTLWTHPWFGLRVIVAEHDDFTLVAFRGTTVVAEYVSNAMVIQKDASKIFAGRAHQGFWGVFERTQRRIHDLIMRSGGDRKPVVFAGHSRGGVFATLFAVNLHDQGGQVAAVYTYAQPRLGDDELAAYIQARIGDRYYRIDVDRDITPQVPPSKDMAEKLRKAGYLHPVLAQQVEKLNYGYDAGSLFVLPAAGGLFPVPQQEQRAEEFWFDFYARLFGPNPLRAIPEIIKDFPAQHKTDLYICRLLESI